MFIAAAVVDVHLAMVILQALTQSHTREPSGIHKDSIEISMLQPFFECVPLRQVNQNKVEDRCLNPLLC